MDEISNSELFADLQVSMTEIFLIELYDQDFRIKNHDRLRGNYQIVEAIKNIMRERFDENDVENFLENGYPRQVRL